MAASILRMPQPTVSRALGTLAELIGTPLVERQGRGIVLTGAGRALLPYARAGLDAVAAGVAMVAQDQVVGQGEVPIAFQTVLGETVVPALIRRFRERYPGVRFALTQGSRRRCLDDLDRGTSAVALVSSPAGRTDAEVIELYEEPMVLVVPRGHHLAAPTAGHGRRDRAGGPDRAEERLRAARPDRGCCSPTRGCSRGSPSRPTTPTPRADWCPPGWA